MPASSANESGRFEALLRRHGMELWDILVIEGCSSFADSAAVARVADWRRRFAFDRF